MIKLEVKHVATMNTTEAEEYVGDAALFQELVDRYELHPIKGTKGGRGKRGEKGTRWLVSSIDLALKVMESQWREK